MCAYCDAKGIDVLGLQEHSVRHSQEGVCNQNMGKGWRFIFGSANDDGRNGVGAILSPRASTALISTILVSPRLLKLTFKLQKERNLVVFVGYSPTSCGDIEKREAFFCNLQDEILQTPARAFVMVLIDANGRWFQATREQ